jgi:hypothetical protein
VLHLGHFPFAIFVPFEVKDSTGSFISTFALHFTQYPCVAIFDLLMVYQKMSFAMLLKLPYSQGIRNELEISISRSLFAEGLKLAVLRREALRQEQIKEDSIRPKNI